MYMCERELTNWLCVSLLSEQNFNKLHLWTVNNTFCCCVSIVKSNQQQWWYLRGLSSLHWTLCCVEQIGWRTLSSVCPNHSVLYSSFLVKLFTELLSDLFMKCTIEFEFCLLNVFFRLQHQCMCGTNWNNREKPVYWKQKRVSIINLLSNKLINTRET
jgi:hypothetical protein